MNFKKIVGKGMAVIVLSTYFTSSAYAAESTESLKADAAEQLNMLQKQQDQKQTLEAQMNTAESKLQEIQNSMNSLKEEIGQVKGNISKVKVQIEKNKEEIVTLEDSMYTRQGLIEERLVAMQQNSKDNILIDILLNSESIGDMIQKAYSVFVLFGADRDILETQQADLDKLEEKKAEIEENEQTLVKRQQQLEEKQAELNELETSQQNTVKDIQAKYDEVNGKIELTKAEQEKIKAKITSLEAAAKEESQLLKTAAAKEEVKTKSNTSSNQAVAKENSTSSSQTGKTENNKKEEQTSNKDGKVLYVTATAYTPAESTTGKTATGLDIFKNPNMKVIAVDPSVIPLGSKVWVEGYGEAIAGDTGGAIKGYKIDILMPTVKEALNFGRRTVKVIVLN